MWFRDAEVRERKQLLTLNQIWSFISQEIEVNNYIENKLKALDDSEEEEEDDEIEGMGQHIRTDSNTSRSVLDLSRGKSVDMNSRQRMRDGPYN